MKYRPDFPESFGCLQDSRAFCQNFFTWYNEEHRHSGIGLLTPAMVHYGQARLIRSSRSVNSSSMPPTWPTRNASSVRRLNYSPLPKEVWINKPIESLNKSA